MRTQIAVAAITVLVGAGCSSATSSTMGSTVRATTTTAAAAPVPVPYQSLVATLQAQVSAFAADAGPTSSSRRTVMAGCLLAADGNLGASLLTPLGLSHALTMLRSMKQLGLRGVMLEVGFPLLLPTFPNSGGYTAFYQRVASMIHTDGMTLSVELNPVFTSPQISSLHPDYRGLTVASYAAEQRQEAQIIIDTMRPDYLTILDEPDTFGSNLSLPLNDPATVAQLVTLELTGLNRRSTKVGAGTGTWSPPVYDQDLLARAPIDYLSVHVYPLARLDVDNLQTDVAAAAQAHRPAVMDETWLYKDLSSGNFDATGRIHPNPAGAANQEKLLAFSFWEPLDQQFLTLITRYARNHGIVFLAPFESLNFFAEVDWTPALDASASLVVRSQQSRDAFASMAASTRSPVGTTYARLAARR